ncbi:Toll/interleukin-1 receptor homology (TIR) domain containing protein [Caulobacteraceae bacterium]
MSRLPECPGPTRVRSAGNPVSTPPARHVTALRKALGVTGIPDIFLSYNREDQSVARRFAEAFEGEGFRVWWDTTLRAGEAYDEVTETALRTAKAVVVLWSPRSVVSRWVRAEATLADRNRTLVPCTIEPCDRPIMFELTQTAELSHWQGEPDDRAWQAFLTDLRRFVGRGAPAAVPSPTVAPPPVAKRTTRPSLAVLPFTNRSGLPEDEVFATGMVEDIIDALSTSRALRVLASGATAAYRKAAVDVAEIGHVLGVRYLMEGNVRRVGDALRVSAQLIEAATGAILWTQKFDRPLTDLALLQEELVIQVAAQLGSQIQRLEIEKTLRGQETATAYGACVRSTIAMTRGDHATSVAEGERAVAIAPDYGGAHACLATALCGAYQYGDPEPDWWRRAQSHIARALALDARNSYVQIWVGMAYYFAGRPAAALPFLEGAVASSPDDSVARQARGIAYCALGRLDEALDDSLAAEALAPNSPSLHNILATRALVYIAQGRLDLARTALDQSRRLMPIYLVSLIHGAVVSQMLGDEAGARAAVLALRAHHPAYDHERCLEILDRQGMTGALTASGTGAAFTRAWDATPDGAS